LPQETETIKGCVPFDNQLNVHEVELLKFIDDNFVEKLPLGNEFGLWVRQNGATLMCTIPILACAFLLCYVVASSSPIIDDLSRIVVVSAYIAVIGITIAIIKEFMNSSDYSELLVQYNYNSLENSVRKTFSDDTLVLFRAFIILKSKQPKIKLTQVIQTPISDKTLYEILYCS